MPNFLRPVSELGYALHLPGLGISEPVGTSYQSYRTPNYAYNNAQGYNPGSYYGPAFGPNQQGGQTLGANTQSYAAPTAGGGSPQGGGQAGGLNPIGPPSYNYDVQPAIDLLEGQIPGLQQNEADQEANINASRSTQLQQAQQGFGAQTQTLNNASDQARVQTSQLLQGIQGRYGGTTGEGSFASTQLGQQAVQTQSQLQQKVAQVQDVARLASQDIEEKAAASINSAKQWLQDSLGQIRSNQATLQSHKADLSYAAMQQYQQYLEQINMGRQNLLSSLAQQAEAARMGLYGALQNGQGIVGNPQAYLSQLGLTGIGGTNLNGQGGGMSAPGTTPGYRYDERTGQYVQG